MGLQIINENAHWWMVQGEAIHPATIEGVFCHTAKADNGTPEGIRLFQLHARIDGERRQFTFKSLDALNEVLKPLGLEYMES